MNSLTEGHEAAPTSGDDALSLIQRHYAEMAVFLAGEGSGVPLPHVYGTPATVRYPRLLLHKDLDPRQIDAHVFRFEQFLSREVSEIEADELIENVRFATEQYRHLAAVLSGRGVLIPQRDDFGNYGVQLMYVEMKDPQYAATFRKRYEEEQAARPKEAEPQVTGAPASRRFPELVERYSGNMAISFGWPYIDAHIQAFEQWLRREVTAVEAGALVENIWNIDLKLQGLREVVRREGVFIPCWNDTGEHARSFDYEALVEDDPQRSDLRREWYETERAERQKASEPAAAPRDRRLPTNRFPDVAARWPGLDEDELDEVVLQFEDWLGREVRAEEIDRMAEQICAVRFQAEALDRVRRGEGVMIPYPRSRTEDASFEFEAFNGGEGDRRFVPAYEAREAQRRVEAA
ncbi:MAG: hypothetical protein ACO1SV_21625 [Fimbriimonas sp.]